MLSFEIILIVGWCCLRNIEIFSRNWVVSDQAIDLVWFLPGPVKNCEKTSSAKLVKYLAFRLDWYQAKNEIAFSRTQPSYQLNNMYCLRADLGLKIVACDLIHLLLHLWLMIGRERELKLWKIKLFKTFFVEKTELVYYNSNRNRNQRIFPAVKFNG